MASRYRKLQMIGDVTSEQDLRVPSNILTELLASRVNGNDGVIPDGERGEACTWTTAATGEARRRMLTTKRKPASVGKILTEEFMEPLGLTQAALA